MAQIFDCSMVNVEMVVWFHSGMLHWCNSETVKEYNVKMLKWWCDAATNSDTGKCWNDETVLRWNGKMVKLWCDATINGAMVKW